MNCLCGMLSCMDQGFCWKAKSCGWWSKHGLRGAALCIMWIHEPHTSVSVENGIVTTGRARRFFLALVVSVTYQPWHLYTFHLCGCWMRRLDFRSVRTEKRVFRNCQSSNVSEDRPWSIQDCPECVVLRHLLECLEAERSFPLASTHDGNLISNMWYCGFNCRTSMAT